MSSIYLYQKSEKVHYRQNRFFSIKKFGGLKKLLYIAHHVHYIGFSKGSLFRMNINNKKNQNKLGLYYFVYVYLY
jgi:hypothetical protein